MINTSTSFSFQAMEEEKQNRFDPIPGTTPTTLVDRLNAFRRGYLKDLAITMDILEERDDLLASVVPKAKAAPTIHGWEVNTIDTQTKGEAERAAAQKEVLEFFYNNLRATSATDQDLLGGLELFLEQLMDAKAKRYSVHNLVFKAAGRGKYTCTAWHVPLWFFEGTTGKLRYLRNATDINGEEMKAGAWMVTVGRGLMIPCSVAWMFKRLPLRDWLLYCSRHGLPGFEGVTDAPEGSPEYEKLVRAVRAAAAGEFAWVRSNSQELNVIDFKGQGELPFPGLVDRMDRAMSAIWRGGDLSTMSKDKQAIGSEGQKGEADIVEKKDAQWLSGQCGMRLSRLVLDYVFGEYEPELAYLTIKTAQKQDVAMDLRIDDFGLKNGHPMSRKQFAERYNRPEPGPEDELLASPQSQEKPEEVKAINEATGDLSTALQRDVLPVSLELAKLLEADDVDFDALAKSLRERLPAMVGEMGDSASGQLEKILTGAFLAGLIADNTKAE